MSSPVGELAKFAVLVGATDGWYRYLVESGIALGIKWAKDAGLLDPSFEYAAGDPENTVIRFLRELLVTARYICFHDDLVQLSIRSTSSRSCPLNNNFESVLSESRHTALYLRNSKYGITTAELKEAIGVYYSDAVPESMGVAFQMAIDHFSSTQIKELPECSSKVVVDPSSSLHSNTVPFQSEVFVVREDDPRMLKYESHFAWVPTVFDVASNGSETHAQSYITGLGPRSRHPKLYTLIEQMLALALPMLDKTVATPVRYGSLKREVLSPSARRWKERAELRRDSPYVFKCRWNAVLRKQERQKASDELRLERDRRTKEAMAKQERDAFDPASIPVSLSSLSSGNKAHVVTKVVTHTLGPGESYEDDWRTEGLPHDKILACAVHCFEADSGIEDVTLSFRRLRREYYDFPSKGENYQDEFWFRLTDGDESESDDPDDYDCPSDWEDDWSPGRLPFTIPLGRVSLREKRAEQGRIITFPNWVQHRLHAKNRSKSGSSQLKLLYFFLVEDSQFYKNSRQAHIELTRGITYDVRSHVSLTTSDMPYPVRDCNLPTLHFLLPIISERMIGRRLPPEIVEIIITSLDEPGSERGSGLGMSRHEMERRRRNWTRDMNTKKKLEREIWDPAQRFRLRSVDDV